MPAVLLVEDDPVISEVVAYQLTRAGYDVTTAGDGVVGLQAIRSGTFDLILLDLMLPRLSGLDLLATLRRDSSTPVIIVSARESEADRVNGLELGADDYLTKPYSIRELLARVRAVLRRVAEASPGTAVECSLPIAVDVDGHEVKRHGEPVRLTPKEFELLAYLVRNANQVCSRDGILDAVWGYGFGGETRTVDVHVHCLRQKLEDDPARPRHILTIRHYGYKFVPNPPAVSVGEISDPFAAG